MGLANVIAVMSTTVQYEALFYEKPILLLGNSILNGLNIGYEISDGSQLQEILQYALCKNNFEEKLLNAKKFIAKICANYLSLYNNA